MKKFVCIFCLMGALFTLFSARACAADDQENEIYAQSGARDAFSVLSDETLSLLETLGVDADDPQSVMRVSPAGVISAVISMFTGGLAAPAKHLATLLGVITLFALTQTLAPALGGKTEPGGMLFMLFTALAVVAPVTGCVGDVLSAIETVSLLMKLLIPVMGGLVASSGAPLTASALSAASVGAAETSGALVDTLFVPLTGAYAAVCVVAAVNPVFHLQSVAQFFRKIYTVALGGVSALFSGVLALRGTAAKAADSLAFKGAKFLIGGLVPVVGGALSDGLATVTTALDAVNDTVGALGVAAIALVLLPAGVGVLAEWAALAVGALVATLVGQEQIAAYLSGISNVIVMLNLLLLFDGFVFICALGMLIGFR